MHTRGFAQPGRSARAGLAALCALAATALLGLAPGRASADDLPPALRLVIAGIFVPPQPFTAADVLKEIEVIAAGTPSPSPSATATATATPTSASPPPSTSTPTVSPTVTPTWTQRACSQDTAALEIETENGTGVAPARVRLRGARREGDCLGGNGVTAYDVTVDCAAGITTCAQLGDLRPGSWVHTVEVLVPATGQVQHRNSIVVAKPLADRLRHRLFPAVATITTTADNGAGSLRAILQSAPAEPKPLLVQFDPAVFPAGVPTSIVWLSAPPPLSASQVTLDGIDATGAVGNRVIDANGGPRAALTVTGGGNHLIGIRLRNAGNNNRDVLSISGPLAVGNLVEQCIVDTAATADAIGVDSQAGTDFAATANVIRDCEVFGAADKGIKVTTGSHARIEGSWVHDNLNGGIQAALGGHVEAFDNLVENNRGATAQNGIAVLGADDNGGEVSFSELDARGNVSRRNGANGLAVRVGASARVRDNYLAVNGSAGIRVFNDAGPAATAMVEGTCAACNGTDGAVVANDSFADFGGGSLESPGNNAFTQNNLSGGFENFVNLTSVGPISAIDNQWEHCGREATCNDAEIRRLDMNNDGANTLIAPAQAHRTLQPEVSEVAPLRGRRGDLIRIFGAGFNAIDGHFAEERCSEVTARNTCVPLRGNCVQIAGVAAPLEAVTPTMLVARWPFTCTAPVTLIVKIDNGSFGVVESEPVTVCE